MFRGKGKLLGIHLLQKVGAREKLKYPEGYRAKRKEVREVNPYLEKSLKFVKGIMKSIDHQQKAISQYAHFLESYYKTEKQFDPEVANRLEKIIQCFQEFPVFEKQLVDDIKKKYIPATQSLKGVCENATKTHDSFKVQLSNFEKLNRANKILKKKSKSANPQQSQGILKRVQSNIMTMEKQQKALDDTYKKANNGITRALMERDTNHFLSLFDILLSFYQYFEEGITTLDKIKPYMMNEIEELNRKRDEYKDPDPIDGHGTWEIGDFDPESFTKGGGSSTGKQSGGEPKQPALGQKSKLPKVPIGTCKAKYDFEAKEKGELPFKKGEKIFVLVKKPEDWSMGINESGQIGEFPWNFVENFVAAEKTRALYDYEAGEENEISFKEADQLTVLHKEPDGWWVGCFANVKGLEIGTFPCNYCELGKDVKV